jgi:hypothetical protein
MYARYIHPSSYMPELLYQKIHQSTDRNHTQTISAASGYSLTNSCTYFRCSTQQLGWDYDDPKANIGMGAVCLSHHYNPIRANSVI